jgi:hypothetical protein
MSTAKTGYDCCVDMVYDRMLRTQDQQNPGERFEKLITSTGS